MTTEKERISVDELTDEQIERILNTRGFRKMLAYQQLAEGVGVLEDQDEIYQSLVTSITNQHKSVTTENSIEEVLTLFRREVEAFTEPLVDADNPEEEVNLDDLTFSEGEEDEGTVKNI